MNAIQVELLARHRAGDAGGAPPAAPLDRRDRGRAPQHGLMAILGVDVGGTFTDAVLLADGALSTAKVPTRPAQEESVVEAARLVLDAAEAPGVERFAHGTTVATNALLERKGARTAFVATEGFEHLLHLRRQNRAHLYRLDVHHPEPLVRSSVASACASGSAWRAS